MYDLSSSGSNMRKRGRDDSGNSSLGMDNDVENKRREKIATNNNESFVEEQSRTRDGAKASDNFMRYAEGKKEDFFRRFDEVVIQRCNQNEYLKVFYSKRLDEIRENLRLTSDPHKVFYNAVMDLNQIIDFRKQQNKKDLRYQDTVFTQFMELIDKHLPRQDNSSSKQPESSKSKQEYEGKDQRYITSENGKKLDGKDFLYKFVFKLKETRGRKRFSHSKIEKRLQEEAIDVGKNLENLRFCAMELLKEAKVQSVQNTYRVILKWIGKRLAERIENLRDRDASSSKQPESSKRKQEKYTPPEDFSTDKAQSSDPPQKTDHNHANSITNQKEDKEKLREYLKPYEHAALRSYDKKTYNNRNQGKEKIKYTPEEMAAYSMIKWISTAKKRDLSKNDIEIKLNKRRKTDRYKQAFSSEGSRSQQ
jgi:hypothetical protein